MITYRRLCEVDNLHGNLLRLYHLSLSRNVPIGEPTQTSVSGVLWYSGTPPAVVRYPALLQGYPLNTGVISTIFYVGTSRQCLDS